MPDVSTAVRIRPLDELDISGIVRIDEKISGVYRPQVWEERVMYYMRRDPGASQVAEIGGKVVGFMLGDVRAGEFGLEEPSGWIERFGIDPEHRGRDLGRLMFAALLAHFREAGVTRARTLGDRQGAGGAGGRTRRGVGPPPLARAP